MEKYERSEPMEAPYSKMYMNPYEQKKTPECWMLLYFQARAISRFCDEFSGWVGKYKLFSWEKADNVHRAAYRTRQVILERGKKFLANVPDGFFPDGFYKIDRFAIHDADIAACMAENFSIDEVNPAAYA